MFGFLILLLLCIEQELHNERVDEKEIKTDPSQQRGEKFKRLREKYMEMVKNAKTREDRQKIRKEIQKEAKDINKDL